MSKAQLEPIATVLVAAGAAARAIYVDLGACTIREELNALRMLGINPLQSLVVPRVLAGGVVAILLSANASWTTLVGPSSRRHGRLP